MTDESTTGTADEALVLQAIKLGVIDYLIKPVAPALLYERVAKVLQPHDPVQDVDC